MSFNDVKLLFRNNKDSEVLNSIRQKILNAKTKDEAINYFKEGFNFLKDIIYDYYDPIEKKVHPLYINIKNILETIPYKEHILSYNQKSRQTHNYNEEFLDLVVRQIRNEVIFNQGNRVKCISYENIDLDEYEKEVEFSLINILKYRHIPYKKLEIYTGFMNNDQLNEGEIPHYAFIVTLDNNKYLLDLTYFKYFLVKYNILNTLGVVGYKNLDVGYYMMLDEKRKNFAQTLINNGWIKLNNENLKYYGDGFALSFRNALYYDKLKKINFSINYNVNDYLKFLNGINNQAEFEGSEVLGRTKKPPVNSALFRL